MVFPTHIAIKQADCLDFAWSDPRNLTSPHGITRLSVSKPFPGMSDRSEDYKRKTKTDRESKILLQRHVRRIRYRVEDILVACFGLLKR